MTKIPQIISICGIFCVSGDFKVFYPFFAALNYTKYSFSIIQHISTSRLRIASPLWISSVENVFWRFVFHKSFPQRHSAFIRSVKNSRPQHIGCTFYFVKIQTNNNPLFDKKSPRSQKNPKSRLNILFS